MVCAWALLATLPVTPAWAQALPDPGVLARESERVQREQEQRRQQQLQQDRASASAPTQLQVPEAPVVAPSPVGSTCRDIRIVTLEGVSRLSARTRTGIARRYEGRCLAVGDVEQLLAEITKAYIDRGYVAARAYLPAQDLSAGTLTVTVVEGKLSRIEVRGKPGSVNAALAFPPMTGKPVNLRMIEQGLDQINRLSSNSATIDLQPGAATGETVLVVQNVPTRRLNGNFSFDTLGSQATGKLQASLTGSVDNLLGLNDYISVTRRQSSPFNNERTGRSSSETYFASVPFGLATLSGGASDSRYRTGVATPSGGGIVLTGNSHSRFATLDFLAVRGRTGQLALSASLATRDNESFVDGQRLDVSSRKLTVLDLDVRGQTKRFGGFATLGVGVSLGLKALSAQEDRPGLSRDTPRAQFAKFRLTASYFNAHTFGKQRVEFTSSLAAQYAADTLFGTEQFSIGGVYSVRGFRESIVANDSGFYFRNDLGIPQDVGRWFGTPLVVKPYIAADLGYARGRVDNGFGGTLAGAAIGSTIGFGRTFVDIFATKRLAAPQRLRNEGVILFGRMSIRL
jgi:hemolysin activation/secretion protein